MSPQKSAAQNAFAPLANFMRRLRHKRSTDPGLSELHQRDAEDLIAPAIALIRDEQMGFAFIHLAVPHPPGVYDRRTAQTRIGGSYLDNLALADRYLGKLLAAISSTDAANKTTIVVCSDHSWRVPMWRNSSIWTPEDERVSNGFFDSRPVLMVHLAGQAKGVNVELPENSLMLHAMLEEMLRGKIADREELAAWIAAW
jgi:membrane-anchored protein YejM (alkaline phosphatase superfamily)